MSKSYFLIFLFLIGDINRNKEKVSNKMFNKEKKVTIEWITDKKGNGKSPKTSNPITDSNKFASNLSTMVSKILEEEIPRLKNNSLLYNLVLYTLTEKMKTVQTVENVLSYIKDSEAKAIQDVSFKNGEIYIKCSI